MVIIGCDFHPGFQQIAMVETDTGEVRDLQLVHRQEAEKFYASQRGREVLVGIEACGYTQRFEQMLEQMGQHFQIGDAAAIRASYERKQKTDRRDAGHILRLLVEGRFPALWVPTAADRDARQLIVHRHKRVELRTRVKNQLHALALNQGLRLRWKLWTQAGLEQLQSVGVSDGAKGQDERQTTAPLTPPLTPTPLYALTTGNVVIHGMTQFKQVCALPPMSSAARTSWMGHPA